jgi:hypothetical protein
MRVILLVLILSISAGCTTDKTSLVKTSVRETVEVSMDSVPVIPNLLFSLYWNKAMGQDKIVLKVTKSFGENLPGGESLHFNLDGEQSDFSSIDLTPEIGYDPGRRNSFAAFSGHVWSSRRYLVSAAFLKKLVNAQTASISVDAAKTKMEGALSNEPPSFRVSAAEFVQALEKHYPPAQ